MTRRGFRNRPTAAVVLALALVASACAGEGPVSGPNVLLVGDSLLTAATDQVIADVSARGWNPTVRAFPGTKIEDWIDSLPGVVAENQPSVAVIELGTNNCGPTDCKYLGPYIDQVMFALSTTDAVLWLNVQEDVQPKLLTTNAWDYVNFELESAAARWPNMFLVDMDGRIGGHPEWHDPDGVHLNAEGNRQLAALIAEALEPFKPT